MYVTIQKYFRNSPLPDNVCDKCEDILCHEETEKQTSEKSKKVPRAESGNYSTLFYFCFRTTESSVGVEMEGMGEERRKERRINASGK